MAIILYARRSVERENSISCETQLAYCRSVIKPDEQDGPVTNRQGSAPWRFVAAYSANTWQVQNTAWLRCSGRWFCHEKTVVPILKTETAAPKGDSFS